MTNTTTINAVVEKLFIEWSLKDDQDCSKLETAEDFARYVWKSAIEEYEKAKEAALAAEDEWMLNRVIATYDPSLRTSIGEGMSVREMTVEDVYSVIYESLLLDPRGCADNLGTDAKIITDALAKLRTIRIIGGGE